MLPPKNNSYFPPKSDGHFERLVNLVTHLISKMLDPSDCLQAPTGTSGEETPHSTHESVEAGNLDESSS